MMQHLNELLDHICTHISKYVKPYVYSFTKCNDMYQNSILVSAQPTFLNIICDLYIGNIYGVSFESVRAKTEITRDVSINNTKCQYIYFYNVYCFEYFITDNKTHEKHIICDFIKNIVSSRCINEGKKHIFKLHINEKIGKHIITALKNIMEVYTSSALFVIMCPNLSYIDETLISRCCIVQCNPIDKTAIFQDCLDTISMDDPTKLLCKELCGNDLENLCVLLKTNTMRNYKDIKLCNRFQLKLEATLDACIILYKNNNDNIAIFETLHTLGLSMMNSIVTFNHVCKSIITYCEKLYPEHLYSIIARCADIEHQNIFVNKTIFAYNFLFMNCIQLFCSEIA
jgi:hypothetical protein